MHYQTIILGAGASGLMCAMQAAGKGGDVLVIDRARRAGEKIRVAGGGRCNVTNTMANAAHYLSGNPHFVKSALARCTPWDMFSLLTELGIPLAEEENGRVFSDLGNKGGRRIARVLFEEARSRGASFLLQAQVEDVSIEGGRYLVELPGETISADSLVLALGGRSWPRLGASDLGHRLARKFGLPLTPVRPGLTPLEAGGEMRMFCASMAGVSLPVTIAIPQCKAPAIAGELLFTHRGVSGPAVLDASLFWTRGCRLAIDLLPDLDLPAALERTPRMELKNSLARLMPQRLAHGLCQRHGWRCVCAALSRKQLVELEQTLHTWDFTPAKAGGWDKAEVTLGGVDTRAISSQTMQAHEVPGLYLTGEVLDVTGRLGGFNLQWAWSSGWAAGENI